MRVFDCHVYQEIHKNFNFKLPVIKSLMEILLRIEERIG